MTDSKGEKTHLSKIDEEMSNNKIIMHFAHANGFPAKSYQKLFDHLPNNIEVIALDKLAHNPKYPLNDNWQNQVDETIHFVEKNANQKVLAVGHSFGAVVSYMSVCKRPDLFSGLIMLDPPLITGLARYIFRFAKKNRLIDRITPAGLTVHRVKRWRIEQDLFTYFSNKALFKDFDKDCIHDYVKAVIDRGEDGQQLNFDVQTEAQIFRTIPHNLPEYANKLLVPATLITGKHTNVCVPSLRRPFLKANKTVKHIEFEKGGHMFPLEYPVLLSSLIADLIATKKDC